MAVEALTVPAVNVKVAEVEPCGIVTLDGTIAAALELESDTDAPPVPAADVRVMVPVADWPLTIVMGLTVMPLNAGAGGFTMTLKTAVAPE